MNYNDPKEKTVLVEALSDHLLRRKSENPGETNWKELFRIALSQQVTGIIASQLGSFMPVDVRDSFDSAKYQTLISYISHMEAQEEIKLALCNAGVTYGILKGLEVAQLYPVPALRTMSDIDIAVCRSDKEKAVSILKGLGYVGRLDEANHEWIADRNDIRIELHDEIVRRHEQPTPRQKCFFNSFEMYLADNGELDWSFHFLYLLMHLRKHFFEHGVGFRQFLDLAMVIHAKSDMLRWEWICMMLKELQLEEFSYACFSLIEEWFSLMVPLSFVRINKEAIKRITDCIFLGGVFGFDNPACETTYDLTRIASQDGPIWLRRLRSLKSKVFVPFDGMIEHREYQYLQRWQFLLPIAWIHRAFMVTFGRQRKGYWQSFIATFMKTEDLAEREKILKDIGLK